jgi:hypothetical protein
MRGVIWGVLLLTVFTFAQNKSDNKVNNDFIDHSLQQINCKTCHSCDVPTKKDPCLNPCPRELMITVNQSPEDGPEIVSLDKLSDKYMPVTFSHRIHSQMSQMSGSCRGCHHYNTAGPILPCVDCHSVERKRDDLSKPDLQAAYHRQCITCHKEWSHSTDCNFCHAPKGSADLTAQKEETKIKGKDHPKVEQPKKLIFETNYQKGKIVTFYHDEHINLFGIDCVSCHQKENCTRCHDKEINLKVISSSLPIKIQKSQTEHHQPCFKCHADDQCSKCHLNKTGEPFNHKIAAGWELNRFHEKLECVKCHTNNNFTKLDNTCTSCHKNFKADLFEHSVTGLKLDEIHSELECSDCHIDNNFAIAPSCNNCHDNKRFPKDRPGNLVKVTQK